MNHTEFLGTPLPAPIERVFDRMLWIGWYDGIASGIVSQTQLAVAFRLDILAWDKLQWQRIFAVSPLQIQSFSRIVRILGDTAPTWPKWEPGWPSGTGEDDIRAAEIEELLATAGRPVYTLASNSDFDMIDQVKELDTESIALLPPKFDGIPMGENFDYWLQYLGVKKQTPPWIR